jgi:BirA family biotin operon repressor/biotin-[acetyl-CoA-carboxylase] ligase
MTENELRALLAGLPIPDLRYFETIGSTNDEAAAWAEKGGPDGALVTANEQTSGRGRNQRHWITRSDQALAFSVLFRPAGEAPERLAFYSPMCALAISRMLEGLDLHPQIKWPNDVLLDRKKISGILVEGSWQGSRMAAIVCGIGINIASKSLEQSDRLLFPASSIEQELGSPVDRWPVLAEILRGLFYWRARIGTPEFLQAWENRLAFRGELVRIEQDGQEPLIGTVEGIDPGSGDLKLITKSGKMEHIAAGDVHLRLTENE